MVIGKFIKYKEVLDSDLDPLEKQIKLISILTDKTEEEVESLPLDEVVKHNFSLDDLPTKVPKTFFLGKKCFDITLDASKITGAQYIDITTILKSDPEKNIHKLMACICIPRKLFLKGKYDGRKHSELSDYFYHHLPIEIAYPVSVFFCKAWSNYMRIIPTYLQEEVRTITTIDGDGISPWMRSRLTVRNGISSTK